MSPAAESHQASNEIDGQLLCPDKDVLNGGGTHGLNQTDSEHAGKGVVGEREASLEVSLAIDRVPSGGKFVCVKRICSRFLSSVDGLSLDRIGWNRLQSLGAEFGPSNLRDEGNAEARPQDRNLIRFGLVACERDIVWTPFLPIARLDPN